MLRCAGKEDAFWLSTALEVALGFVDGLDFEVTVGLGVGRGYGAERGPELRRFVLGMFEGYGGGSKGLNHVEY